MSKALSPNKSGVIFLASRSAIGALRQPLHKVDRGFAFITAIFLLVILAAFAAFVISFSTGSAATSAVAVQSARAYEAARVGLEWGTFQIKDPTFTLAPGDTPRNCFASPTALGLPDAFSGFNVIVSCERFPSFSGSPNYHEENGRRVALYVLTATATYGIAGELDYVERRIEARIEVCKDPAAAGPNYSCR